MSMEIEKLKSEAKAEVENVNGKDGKFKPLSLSELMNKEFKEIEWVIEKLIPAEGIVVLSGSPATFKTWLILDIAIQVAKGDSLYGKFATNQTGVLIVDEENGERLLKDRLQKFQQNNSLPVFLLSLKGFRLSEKNVTELINYSKDNDVGLIMFDSLVRIHDEDENDATKMNKVFRHLKEFGKAGISVLFTHHNRKQGAFNSNPSQEMRGSSDILASVDCHLATKKKKNEEYLEITQNKLRQDEEIQPFKLRIIREDKELKLEFAGEVDEVEDKKADFKGAIKDLLEQEDKPMYKQQIFDSLKDSGVTGGQSTFKAAVEELVNNKKLFEQRGEKNKMYCSLKPFGIEQTSMIGDSLG